MNNKNSHLPKARTQKAKCFDCGVTYRLHSWHKDEELHTCFSCTVHRKVISGFAQAFEIYTGKVGKKSQEHWQKKLRGLLDYSSR